MADKDYTDFERMSEFKIPEGFARVTRGNHADIYVIQNRMPLGQYVISVAYSMDDFQLEKNVGYTLLIRGTDRIEHLGGIKEYFVPAKSKEQWKSIVFRKIGKSVGFLPVVRACEQLKSLNRTPSADEINQEKWPRKFEQVG